MNTDQIQDIMEREMGPMFQGVFPYDKLPMGTVPLPCCVVANTDPENKPGKHWVGFYFDDEGHGDYFDSYGLPPNLYPKFQQFLIRNSPMSFTWSGQTLQGQGSLSCGQYVVYYLFHRWLEIPPERILDAFSVTDRSMNDCLVSDWLNERYDMSTLCHVPWPNCQTCKIFD
jgi:hypothetical protein